MAGHISEAFRQESLAFAVALAEALASGAAFSSYLAPSTEATTSAEAVASAATAAVVFAAPANVSQRIWLLSCSHLSTCSQANCDSNVLSAVTPSWSGGRQKLLSSIEPYTQAFL